MKLFQITGESAEYGGKKVILHINRAQITLIRPLGDKGCTVQLSDGTSINVHDKTPDQAIMEFGL